MHIYDMYGLCVHVGDKVKDLKMMTAMMKQLKFSLPLCEL